MASAALEDRFCGKPTPAIERRCAASDASSKDGWFDCRSKVGWLLDSGTLLAVAQNRADITAPAIAKRMTVLRDLVLLGRVLAKVSPEPTVVKTRCFDDGVESAWIRVPLEMFEPLLELLHGAC
jgi:hypothetical protein